VIIIIDGYNLLKQVFPKVKGAHALEKQRNTLIRQLGHYKSNKVDSIREIIVVFDGGVLLHATREVHDGVVVILSGQRGSADEWIINYVRKNKEKELLLVTMDRQIKDECRPFGADAIDVFDFYNLVQGELLDAVAQEMTHKSEAQKYAADDDAYADEQIKKEINNDALDLLMEQYGDATMQKDDDYKTDADRKSKGKKLSKKEKALYKKIKKL